ncbi:MAG TPA: hypothetical protein VHK86_07860 [Nitrososphaera sp.]|jgi:hypothetical protein|nr:hypothetical protein [Nitrososphaera sp.]
MAIASFLIPYQVAVQGSWYASGYVGSVDVSPLFASFPIAGLFFSIAALVIGIGTLRRKKWTWKGNIVFQLIVIPVLVSTIVLPFFITYQYGYGFVVVPYQNVILLVISTAILVLLMRRKTRIEFGNV